MQPEETKTNYIKGDIKLLVITVLFFATLMAAFVVLDNNTDLVETMASNIASYIVR